VSEDGSIAVSPLTEERRQAIDAWIHDELVAQAMPTSVFPNATGYRPRLRDWRLIPGGLVPGLFDSEPLLALDSLVNALTLRRYDILALDPGRASTGQGWHLRGPFGAARRWIDAKTVDCLQIVLLSGDVGAILIDRVCPHLVLCADAPVVATFDQANGGSLVYRQRVASWLRQPMRGISVEQKMWMQQYLLNA